MIDDATTAIASTSDCQLTINQLVELEGLLYEARRRYLDEYRADHLRERELVPADPGDLADSAESDEERESLFAAAEFERETLEQIEEALRRVAAGEYGRCLECGEPIPFDRLWAVPWARYCEEHQEVLEAETARS